MAEPLILCAEIALPRTAFLRWLALPMPVIAEAAGFAETSGITNIGEFLASLLTSACELGTGSHLMCRYDKSQKTLQLATYLYDGSTLDARTDACQLIAVANAAIGLQRSKKVRRSIAIPYGDIPEALLSDAGKPSATALSANDATPDWFDAWLKAIPTMDSREQSRWVDPEIRFHRRKMLALQHASPEHPVHIGTSGMIYTDGEKVYVETTRIIRGAENDSESLEEFFRVEYEDGPVYVLEGANPRAMRMLGETFYSDGRCLWHYDRWSGVAPSFVTHCEGHAPRVFLFVDRYTDALAVVGDCAWNAAYDDNQPPEERFYIRSTEVDGSTFERIPGTDTFRDRFGTYTFEEWTGLSPVTECERRP
jgi:hypothetical protein